MEKEVMTMADIAAVQKLRSISKKAAKPSAAPARPTLTEEELRHQIEARAYGFYLERGKEDGHDLADWLQAEEQVLSEIAE